ncbi:MAG: LysM peptidoglycan-binding domain-containing M23 family metallopeptidase [Pseudanabaena sp. ELA645]
MISYQATVTPVIIRADITPKVDLTNWWESQNIGAKVHQVQAGDTLYKLTQLYHVDAAAIATSNGISAVTDLPIGTRLVIPPIEGIVYKVRPDDTLSQIANLYQVPQQAISHASGILANDYLRIEQPLVIPGDVSILIQRQEEKTKQELVLKRDVLRQRLLQLTNEVPPLTSLYSSQFTEPPLTDKNWVSRFHFQGVQIPTELAMLPESEARMTTVALFRLTKDLETLDHLVNNQEKLIASTTPRPVSFDRPNQLDTNLPTLSPQSYLPDQNSSSAMIWPTEGTISSDYGWRWGKIHQGIDIAAEIDTPVWAVSDGIVEFAGWDDSGYGNMLDIRHHDGSITRYAHLNVLFVKQGDAVTQSQVVAAVGSTGHSTGPHLHFEIHPHGGIAADPIAYLSKTLK